MCIAIVETYYRQDEHPVHLRVEQGDDIEATTTKLEENTEVTKIRIYYHSDTYTRQTTWERTKHGPHIL